jgi:p-methyltransferase
MELLNDVRSKATGNLSNLNVFKSVNLGACYLAHRLRVSHLSCEVVNTFRPGRNKLEELVKKGAKSVAVLTTYYTDSKPIKEIVNFVKFIDSSVKVIVGGPYVVNIYADNDTVTQDYLLSDIGADIYITDSQGHETLTKVVSALQDAEPNLGAIANLIFKAGNDKLQHTPTEAESGRISDYIIDWRQFGSEFQGLPFYVRTAISCPFACAFCNYPTMAGQHRVTGIELVEAELSSIADIGGQYIVFIDDTFNVPLPRFKQILRMMIRRNFGFKWISFFRCSNADEEAFELMRDSGCIGVFLGIESGDQKVLQYMNKAATLEAYRRGIARLQARDIWTYASFIVGFPGESDQSAENTFNFIESTAPTFFNLQLYYHDRRSPIHARAQEFGLGGAGYSWSHRSMDWHRAASWIEHIFESTHNSYPMTLYGFSIWCVPYLLSQGITKEQILGFTQRARPHLLNSWRGSELVSPQNEQELLHLFANGLPMSIGENENSR